jgi:hypothetical protein
MLGCRALEWIDARFKPAEHVAFQIFVGNSRVRWNLPSAASKSWRTDRRRRPETG